MDWALRLFLFTVKFGFSLPKKGRGQEAEGRKYNFCRLPKGFKAPKFMMLLAN
jgi:hypothetical protein